MPTILLPNFFSDGLPVSADSLSEDFYAPNTTPDSYEVINGFLDEANREVAAWPDGITRDHLQRNSMSISGMIGGTANLDFFTDWWPGLDTAPFWDKPNPPGTTISDQEIAEAEARIAIPGGCGAFYLPWPATLAMFEWNVSWANDGWGDPLEISPIQFVLNGTYRSSQRRLVPNSLTQQRADSQLPTRNGNERDRRFCGAYLRSNMAQGWHNAGLYIASTAPQARVRVRAFRYIAFR